MLLQVLISIANSLIAVGHQPYSYIRIVTSITTTTDTSFRVQHFHDCVPRVSISIPDYHFFFPLFCLIHSLWGMEGVFYAKGITRVVITFFCYG